MRLQALIDGRIDERRRVAAPVGRDNLSDEIGNLDMLRPW